MCAEIERLGYMDHIIFISFYLENLVALRKNILCNLLNTSLCTTTKRA